MLERNGNQRAGTALEQILALLDGGGTFVLKDVIDRLKVSPALAGAMIDMLARQGYLAPMEAGCGHGCGGCDRRQEQEMSCASQAGALVLTAKGRAAAQARSAIEQRGTR